MVKLNRNDEELLDDEEYLDDEEEYDEEEYDDEEEDDEEDEGNPWVKRGIIGAIVVAVVGGALAIRMGTSKPAEEAKPEEPKTEQTSSVQETTTQETTVAQTTVPKVDEDSAKASLERPDAPATDEETKGIGEKIVAAIDKMKADPINARNDKESGLYLTGNTAMNALRGALSVGFTPDVSTLKGYKSDNDNALQFTIRFKAEGREDITFTGNYVPAIEQLEFAQLHGKLDLASTVANGSGEQVDDEKAISESDKPLHPERIKDATPAQTTQSQSE